MERIDGFTGLADPRIRLRVYLVAWSIVLLALPFALRVEAVEPWRVLWWFAAILSVAAANWWECYYANNVLRARHPDEYEEFGWSGASYWQSYWWRQPRTHRFLVWSGRHEDILIRRACLNLWLSYAATAGFVWLAVQVLE